MPRDSLTPKQEAFAHKYVETSNASEAYRFAYNTANSSLPTIWVESSRLLDDPKVALRIEQLKERSLAHVDVSASDIAREAWNIARADDAPHSARVSALSLLAKRHPEFSDKHDVKVDQRTQVAAVVAGMTQDEMREYVRRTLSLNEGANDE